jgi:tetratricopeptide (TPR) repeat protein
VQQQLVKQTIFGDGLLAYRSHAREVLDAEELLTSLREALEARPDLWHAWSAVIAQLSEMGRLEEAERVANEAAERFPLLPRIWLDVAGVNRARNQPQLEIAALKTALEINPTWGQAVRQLSELHERLGQFEKSRELLEQAVKSTPLDAYNHGCLADALWKLGRREDALERIQNAVKIEPGYQWAWDALVRWSGELHRPELADEIARDLTVRRAGEARSWIVLARTLRRPEDLEERLAALTKAIELNPRALDAYDLRARLLAEAKRFDEATAACCPVSWEHLPSRLQARAAWIEAERGNLSDAIAKMRQVVQDDPNMYWAWACLADWYRATGAKEDYLKTAELLNRLWPLEAVPMGYLGEAKLWAGDRAGAREILRAAMARYPDYDFAAATLFDIELEDRNRDEAAAALAVLRLHAPGLMTMARGVHFASHYETGEAAVRALRELAAQETRETEPLELAARAMGDAHMREYVVEVLRDAVQRENVSPIAGGLLVEQLCKLRRWGDARTFAEAKLTDGEVGRSAARALFYHFAADGQDDELTRLLRARHETLRGDTEMWGWTGYALHSLRYYKQAVEWMSDWRTRSDAESWMLVNLAEALRALGRDDEAREVHRHALTLASAPTPRSIHSLWLAADAALAGAWPDVTALLARVEPNSIRPCHQFLRGLVDALVRAGRDQRPLREVRQLLESAEATYPAFREDRELRLMYRRCLKRLSALLHGVRAWWYFLNKRFSA